MGSDNGDRGFTLIELSVVIVIIGILIAVAMVTFLGVRGRASDTAAQSRVIDGLKAQKVIYSDGNGYTNDPLALEAAEPSIDFRDDTVVLGAVFVKLDDGNTVTLASQSASGTCFWVKDTNGARLYAKGSCDIDGIDVLEWGDDW